MSVRLRCYTDPACAASWAAQPALRSLMVEFGADLSITYVMAGYARELDGDQSPRVSEWLDTAAASRMPLDPRLWTEGPIASTYPACMAVKAAAEQGPEAAARYLRAVQEGLFCFRRKLDAAEALVEEARRAGLDTARFRIDLESHAIVEAFGADLEETRSLPAGGELPRFRFEGEGGAVEWAEPGALTAAARAVGAVPVGDSRPGVLAALERFGPMATVEVEAVCDLPGPRAPAELWGLAAEWRVKPIRVLTGMLWELA